ncbi:Uncharacterised protein [uncultured Clostridium sp.]|uniref:hypothetical protein n=1 Tax=Flintibacter hominis TaxID=2763048 RepID=UPI0008235693|nr:hypothetical protein [Flintibacter hominis]SCH85860.1 Uncharacterised protein [uncultured Clostridium sp.]
MNNAQYSYFTEIEIALQKVGYTVQPEEKGSCQLNGMTADCANSPRAAASADTTDPAAEVARGQVTDIAGVVREYMTLIEQAPDLKANGLGENYKLLAEFNGAVLAGHSSRYGVEFVTWEWNCGQTGLFVGTEHYGGPGDFELRGGVIESVNPSERTCSVRGEFFTMCDVPLHDVLGRYDETAEGEHYGFPHVRPLFGEKRDLAGQYRRETEESWNAQQTETQASDCRRPGFAGGYVLLSALGGG